jgi:hypothetical protein
VAGGVNRPRDRAQRIENKKPACLRCALHATHRNCPSWPGQQISFVPARGWTIFGFNPRAPFRSCRGHDKRRFCLLRLRLRPGRGDLDGGKLLTTRLRRRRRRDAWSRNLAGRGKRGSRCCRPGASLPGCRDVCAKAAAQSDEIRKDVEASHRGRNDLIGKLPSTHTNCATSDANRQTRRS